MNFERFLEKRRRTLAKWLAEQDPSQTYSLEAVKGLLASQGMICRPETVATLQSLVDASTGQLEPVPASPTLPPTEVVPDHTGGLDAVDDDVVTVNFESADTLPVSSLVGSALPPKTRTPKTTSKKK